MNDIKEFLDNNSIPKIQNNKLTFLEISKQPHYENVISNIYAFFLNPYEEHNLKDLFISSLLDLINKKVIEKKLDKNIEFHNDFEILREKGTEGKKRIDLLIQNSENVIIIENKIYHELNNPLGNYWDSKKIIQVSDNEKIGILLTLWKQDPNNSNYINITHIEWLNKVFEKFGRLKQQDPNKFTVLFHDFYQNIKNLTNKMKENEIDFVKKNISKIEDVVKLKFAMRKHLVDETERACALLDGNLKLDKISYKPNKKRLRYYRSTKNKDLVFTIVFDELLKENGQLHIIIELQNNSIAKIKEKYDEIIKEVEGTFNPTFKKTNETWAHFAHIPNCRPTSLEIENLSHYIIKRIKDNNMLNIFKKLETYL